jgi:Rrf2 family nitric oxide-sensitive transcriptional repressor
MQLTRFSDFGLRLLMYLTQHDRATPITVGEIAEQFEVPHNHLVKVANKLGKMGLVTAIRGRNGGLMLAQPAASIKLGDTLRGLEGDAGLVNCVEPPCVLKGQCLLSGVLRDGLNAFYDRMNEVTLADVSANRTGTAIISMHRNYMASLNATH